MKRPYVLNNERILLLLIVVRCRLLVIPIFCCHPHQYHAFGKYTSLKCVKMANLDNVNKDSYWQKLTTL